MIAPDYLCFCGVCLYLRPFFSCFLLFFFSISAFSSANSLAALFLGHFDSILQKFPRNPYIVFLVHVTPFVFCNDKTGNHSNPRNYNSDASVVRPQLTSASFVDDKWLRPAYTSPSYGSPFRDGPSRPGPVPSCDNGELQKSELSLSSLYA